MLPRIQFCFRALQVCFQHLKSVRALDWVSCSKIFLGAGNSPVALRNSTEHAQPLLRVLIKAVRFHATHITNKQGTVKQKFIKQNPNPEKAKNPVKQEFFKEFFKGKNLLCWAKILREGQSSSSKVF